MNRKLKLIIILICFSCLVFGQDTLHIDTTPKPLTIAVQDSVIADSGLLFINDTPKKKIIQRKKVKKTKAKEEAIVSKTENIKNSDNSGDDSGIGIVIIVILLIVAIVVILFRLFFGRVYTQGDPGSRDDNYLSDYLARQLLPRREYYRNVYLKSEAWKRKRYVVLKRDNWRCVYCGGKATQVHHTRYAKRNIGKEPIEWLVSICKTCHEAKH